MLPTTEKIPVRGNAPSETIMSRFEFDPMTREPFPQGDDAHGGVRFTDPPAAEGRPNPRDSDERDERGTKLVRGTPYGLATECARD